MSRIGLNGFTNQIPPPYLIFTGKEVHESNNRGPGAALTQLRSDTDYRFLSTQLIKAPFLTFHLFWDKAPLCQGRPAAHCSKMAGQIFHVNEWFDDIFFAFL